jgi:uncharacterized membrane protein SirB2
LDYLLLKSIHQLLALISLSSFILRWAGRMQQAAWTQARITRTLPHIIDTLFLISGLALAWQLALLNSLPSWLLAKLIGLVIYIILGALAMRQAPRLLPSLLFFLAATSCFLWIVTMAIYKSPLGLLSALQAT